MARVYPPMKLKDFVDDITACQEVRNKELPKVAEKVPRTLRTEVEEMGLESSITEGGQEGKSKVMA